MWGEFDMTRRKVIFWNDLNDSYIVSEEYNGDKAEMERFGLGACDHTCLLYTSDAADEL